MRRFVKDGRGRVAAVPPQARIRSAGFRGVTYFAVDPTGARTEIDPDMVDDYLAAGWLVTREAPAGPVWGEATEEEWRVANTPPGRSRGDGD